MNPHHHTQHPATVEPVAETYSELAAPRSAYVVHAIATAALAGLAIWALLITDDTFMHLVALALAAASGWFGRSLSTLNEEKHLFRIIDGDVAHARHTGMPVRPVGFVHGDEEDAA